MKQFTHDFQDGRGPVAARRHASGGGIVALSAKVESTVYVGPDAQILGDAQISGNARIWGDARIWGNARILGDAQIDGCVPQAQRSDGYTFACFRLEDGTTRVTAGCRFFTFAEARDHWTRTRGGTPLGDETITILRFLRRRAIQLGWIVPKGGAK